MSDASELIRPDAVDDASASQDEVTRSRRETLRVRHGDLLRNTPLSLNPTDAPGDGHSIAAGDAAAFERLFLAYADRLCRYMNRYVKSWAEAEELVQDVFLRLWQRRAVLAAVRDIEPYLYSLARYRALNYLRHRRVEEREAGRADPEADVVADEELPGEVQAAIQRAVDTLPPRQREVLILRWREQASYREIMARLGISEQTVGTHLRRALDQLRKILPRFL